MRFRVDGHLVDAAYDLAGQRVEPGQLVDLVTEQANPERMFLIRRHHFHDVAAHPEGAAAEFRIVAFVLDLHELAQDLVTVDSLAKLERQQHAVIRLRRSEAVDARDAGDDDDVAPFEQ